MQESFLHYIWQFQYFDKAALATSEGEDINIIHPGFLNKDSGPDFSTAKIRIGNYLWTGNIEIHIKASDWYLHNHQKDEAYENVILHIVWENDKPIQLKDGSYIPTLELKTRVSHDLLLKYNTFVNSTTSVACSPQLNQVKEIIILSMLDKALLNRLKNKSELLSKLLILNNNDWQETTYQILAKNFGFKINSEAFLALSKSLPYKTLLKHKDNISQIEALVFGIAGFLHQEPKDEYHAFLKREYSFLKHKYSINNELRSAEWKFLRLRPANFPTVRLAQFAMLLSKVPNLFSLFTEFTTFEELKLNLKISQSTYWQEHYNFGKKSQKKISGLGETSFENLLINTGAPLLASYSRFVDNEIYMDKAVELLENLKGEDNNIISLWKSAGLKVQTAHDSQALIELYNNFCLEKKCLSCNIGTALIR
jgi:hypothetical protein